VKILTNPKKLVVGNVEANRGEKKIGSLYTFEMRDGSPVDIPVLVINGAEEGPIVATECGVHANEPLGTMAIIETFKMLDPSEMKGAFIAVPMATPSAFQHGWRYNILDLQSISYPGSPKGTITNRMAHAIYTQCYEPSDIYIQWHSNFIPCLAWGSAIATADEEMNLLADKLMKSTGITYIGGPGVTEFPPKDIWGLHGKIPPRPHIFLEPEGSNTMERRNVRAVRKALLNAIKTAGVVDGKLEKMNGDCFKLDPPKGHGFTGYLPPELGFEGNLIRAERGGIVVKEAEDAFIGRKIEEGTVIARIYNLYGEEREVIKAPCDGYIWGWPLRTVYGLQTPAVYTGAEICYWFVEKELREPYLSM
jgi:predicted deacylase